MQVSITSRMLRLSEARGPLYVSHARLDVKHVVIQGVAWGQNHVLY